jgi:hypothetical protein
MHVVAVQNQDKIHFVPVVIGKDMDTHVEVLSDIQASDTLVQARTYCMKRSRYRYMD